ncbi:MAG: FAD-binding oxidoreductase, partial [Chloroflexota bacterium]
AEGPQRLKYGTLRDLVVGLTVIEVDGTCIRCGGRVVKNVSGYDMVKLFHGSHGTLGIITSVTLRTLPQPPQTATMLATFVSRKQALAMAQSLAATPLTPSAVEYLEQGALRALRQDGAHGLAMRVEDVAAACTRHLHDIRALASQHEASSIHTITDYDTFWRQLADLATTYNLPQDATVLRLVVEPANLDEALAQASEHGTVTAINARAQIGVIYARLQVRAGELNALQQTLTQRWGHSHVLACDPGERSGITVWGKSPVGVELMRALKQQFDPAHTLNPGRLPV